MANVRLVDLTKHYKRGSEVIKALDGVTLDIDKGEFVAVVGRSGSGKTTMLDLLGLLLKPTSGSLFIDDIETAQQLVDLLKRLNREDQVTIVLVTHDTDISGQARRQIRLKDGRVLTDERVGEGIPVA